MSQYQMLCYLRDGYPMLASKLRSVECGPGWLPLVEQLFQQIQEYIDIHPEVDALQVSQVKQKFGGLRVYYHGGDQACVALIEQAALRAKATCEICGSNGSVREAGGIIVRCDQHLPTVAGSEVASVLASVAARDLVIKPGAFGLSESGSLQPALPCNPRDVYCGIWVGQVSGWLLGIYIDCDFVDYVEWAVSPDKRVGQFANWDQANQEPIAMLLEDEQKTLQAIIEAISLSHDREV